MKTKISLAIIALSFLMGCGSSEQSKEQGTNAATGKFVLKAFNMKYLALGPGNVLIANQTDSTKAEVFEKIDLGNGKYNLKASNGLFVCDDRAKDDSVFADKTNASDWEQFEIIAVDEMKVNIKSSSGKYVSANLGESGVLFSKYDHSSDWEVFFMEKR